jgi:rubrerythrin
MGEPIATASAIINLAEKFEDNASNFYQKLAQKFEKNRATFLSFAEESKKNKVLVVRTYRETISDALEACFSFEGLNPNDYEAKLSLGEDTSFPEALRMAIELEDKASKFYIKVADLSKNLLATIPAAFRKVAEKRNSRKQALKLLLDKAATEH